MASGGSSPTSMGNISLPYTPMVWTLGGPPVKRVDIPAQTIFMFFFLVGSIVHMKIFQGNRGRGHKFLPNLFIFLFCMSRVVTSILRIISVSRPKNVHLALAAQIFVASGVVVLFIINLVFTMRIVRSTHRSFGWHPAFGIMFKLLFVLIGATILMVIAATIQGSYTLNLQIRATDRALQLYGSTALAIVATLPLPMLAFTLLIPYSPLDQFGTGRLRTKVIALLVSTTLLSIGAWYRCGATWQTPVPKTQPLPGYLGKPPFYIFNFLFEFQTVMMYAILRVDQRFHIPSGATGPGSYSRPKREADLEMQDSRPTSATETATLDRTNSSSTIASEADDLDSKSEVEVVIKINEKELTPPPKLLSPPLSRPTSSRPHSLLHQVLTRSTTTTTTRTSSKPTREQKRQWRDSEEARIITRLGGPWSRLPSPTESTFSAADQAKSPSPTNSTFSQDTCSITPGTGLSRVASSAGTAEPPSIRDTLRLDGDWTPEIDWELASPRRFLSLKKRSMSLLSR